MLSPLDIARRRFASQYLAEPTLRSPADVVGWLGAVQAQDYLAAKWGVAQRTVEPKDAAVEQALNAGHHPAHPCPSPDLAFRARARHPPDAGADGAPGDRSERLLLAEAGAG